MSSFFRWSTSDAPPVDAPLHALPPAEATPLTALTERVEPLLTSAGSELAADDPWRSLTPKRLKELSLRFLRFQNLDVDKAYAQIERAVAWRAVQKPALWSMKDIIGRDIGLPVLKTEALGNDGEILLYSALACYVKSEINHKMQETGMKALFEELAYSVNGAQASSAVLIIDAHGLCYKNVDLVATKNGIRIFMEYYPEVFSRILFVEYPKFMRGVWNCISPLLDKRTVNRVIWVQESKALQSELRKSFASDQLPGWLGGTAEDGPLKLMSGATVNPTEVAKRLA